MRESALPLIMNGCHSSESLARTTIAMWPEQKSFVIFFCSHANSCWRCERWLVDFLRPSERGRATHAVSDGWTNCSAWSAGPFKICTKLIQSTLINMKSLKTAKHFELTEKHNNTVISPQHVSILDFVRNLDCHRQLECTTRVALIVETYRLSPSVHRTSCSHATVHKKHGWMPEKKRDAYAGTSLNWPAALSTKHCLDCDGADIVQSMAVFWHLKFWILSINDGHVQLTYIMF